MFQGFRIDAGQDNEMSDPTIPRAYEELLMENQRLKATSPIGQKATLYVIAIVILCFLFASFVLLVTFIRPDKDNATLILSVTGVVVPIITALLAATIQQVHLAVNSRLSQLLELTAASSKAEGQLVRRKEKEKEKE